MAAVSLFAKHFWQERARFGETPSELIRKAGKASKAWPDGEDEKWWLANGPAMVEKYSAWRDTVKWPVWSAPDGKPGIELEILANVGIDKPIKMIIDRVFVAGKSPMIVDLKSGARSPVSDLQLGIYRVGILQHYGVRIDYGAYYDARKGELSPPLNLSRYTPSLIAHWFRMFYDAYKQQIFIPNLTTFCRSCGVRDYCLAYGGAKSHKDSDNLIQVNGGN